MNRLLRSGALGAAAAVIGAGAVAPPATAQPAPPPPVRLSAGHVDAVDVWYESGALSLRVNDDTGASAVLRDPSEVVFHALPAAETAVPDLPDFAFLGAPGDPVWILPQIQDPQLLWPGWNTERISSGAFAADQLTLSLVDAMGPGEVFVYIENAFGLPVHQFSSGSGLPRSTQVPVRTHTHANWAFTAEGTYTLRLQVDATLTGGAEVSSGPVDYTFVVGEPTGGPEVVLTVQGADGAYAVGEQVTLHAVAEPDPGLPDHAWYRRCPGEADFAPVPGEAGGEYSFTATGSLHGCAYLAELLSANAEVVARSAPVTLTVTGAGGPGVPAASQRIVAAISDQDGALVMSVDPDDRVVHLSPAELAPTGDRLVATGELRPVTVTDTRAGAPGWDASGDLADFTAVDGGSFGAKFAGWSPVVSGQAEGQSVVAGPVVPPGFTAGAGLAGPAGLAAAPAGAGRGTAVLGAGLRLELPTQTPPGEYRALLTLTAI